MHTHTDTHTHTHAHTHTHMHTHTHKHIPACTVDRDAAHLAGEVATVSVLHHNAQLHARFVVERLQEPNYVRMSHTASPQMIADDVRGWACASHLARNLISLSASATSRSGMVAMDTYTRHANASDGRSPYTQTPTHTHTYTHAHMHTNTHTAHHTHATSPPEHAYHGTINANLRKHKHTRTRTYGTAADTLTQTYRHTGRQENKTGIQTCMHACVQAGTHAGTQHTDKKADR